MLPRMHHMKLVAFIIFYLLSLSTAAQNWEVSYEQALSRAAQENKPIVLVFAGSDWCAPCIKLDREIWTSEIFKAHALKNYVLYRADFPRKKKNHSFLK